MEIMFEVPGAPYGKQRPRHNRFSGATYTPEETKEYEAKVAWAYKAAAKGFRFPDKVPLYVAVYANYPIPKRTTKKERAAMLAGEIRPTIKPDYDNVAKIVTDALNGIAFRDDAAVVDGVQRKWYADKPGVIVLIREAVLGIEVPNGK